MIARGIQAIVGAGFAIVLAGCASVVYKANLPTPAARALTYPVPVYTPEMKVPRPCQVLGTIAIVGHKFTMFGGSSEAEFNKLMREAHKKGADAVKVRSVEKPGFTNPNFTITADLLRYTDRWETAPLTKFQFQAYLESHRGRLDPIEGFWYADLPRPHSIAIMHDETRPGRQFIGFIVDDHDPVWPPGTKKIDIRRGLEPGSYVLTYYLDDFASREIPIILGNQKAFRINLPKDEQDFFITYTKY